MTYTVTLTPSQNQFAVEENSLLLDAGLQQGIGLPYGCKSGVCGSCKGKVLSGDVVHGAASEQALTTEERSGGITLMCCATARSNLTIEIREIQGSSDYPVKIMPARVQAMNPLASDVMILQLKLPANEKFRFRPGQYIDILLKDGQRRSFSIANAPPLDEGIELHIRRVDGGTFTDHVFTGMKVRDILRIEGPLGSFFLRGDDQTPTILLAGGTGFAPIKSIVESSLVQTGSRPMHLFWGAAGRPGLYLDELARHWAATHKNFRYTPVLSNPQETDWCGRTGLVHRAVMEDYPDLSTHQVYACGSPAMIAAAQADFLGQCRLPEDAFFSDAFTFSTAPVRG